MNSVSIFLSTECDKYRTRRFELELGSDRVCKKEYPEGGLALVRISEKARNFIFQHIDSVELLEILLLLYGDPKKAWSAEGLARELRSNPNSAAHRLAVLKNLNLIRDAEVPNHFCYQTDDLNQNKMVEELSVMYRVHRYRVLEIIFSPIKKARDFADAFVVSSKKNEGDDRG